MTKTIFRNSFLIGISVLALCALLFFGIQYTQTKDETFTALQQETAYAEQGLLSGGASYLEKLDDTNRITWIDANGEVLYDNTFTLPLANEKESSEVVEALETGEGKSILNCLEYSS